MYSWLAAASVSDIQYNVIMHTAKYCIPIPFFHFWYQPYIIFHYIIIIIIIIIIIVIQH